jgi:hypothetical protein
VTPPWRFPLENSSLVRWCGVIPVRKQGRVARTNRATIVHVRARCTNASVASRNHLGDFVGDARGNRFSAESADASFYWSKLATLARPLISPARRPTRCRCSFHRRCFAFVGDGGGAFQGFSFGLRHEFFVQGTKRTIANENALSPPIVKWHGGHYVKQSDFDMARS